MKKYTSIGFVLVAVLLFASCAKGGSIIVINEGTKTLDVSVSKNDLLGIGAITGAMGAKTIQAGGQDEWSFSDNGTYKVQYGPSGVGGFGGESKSVSLSGGKTETVTIK